MKHNKIMQLIKKYRAMGFSESFCREEYFVEEFRQLYPGYVFTHQDLPQILKHYINTGRYDEMEKEWEEALRLYNEAGAAKETEKQKNKKVRDLNRDMAYAIITSELKERGVEYAIEMYEYRMVVYVSIMNKWQAEFSIAYSKFDIESCQILENVERLIEIQRSETPMSKLQRINRRMKWERV